MQKHSEDLTLKKIAVIRTDFPENSVCQAKRSGRDQGQGCF